MVLPNVQLIDIYLSEIEKITNAIFPINISDIFRAQLDEGYKNIFQF